MKNINPFHLANMIASAQEAKYSDFHDVYRYVVKQHLNVFTTNNLNENIKHN